MEVVPPAREGPQALNRSSGYANYDKAPYTAGYVAASPQQGWGEHAPTSGFRPVTFWLSIGFLVIIGVVGGTLGGFLAKKSSVSSCVGSSQSTLSTITSTATLTAAAATITATTTITTTTTASSTPSSAPNNELENFSVPEHTSIASIAVDCVELSQYTAQNSSNVFTMSCNEDYPSGNGNVDMVGIWSYSVEDCLEACSVMNGEGWLGMKCLGAAFDVNMNGQASGNCWLKGALGSPSSGGDRVFGRLVGS